MNVIKIAEEILKPKTETKWKRLKQGKYIHNKWSQHSTLKKIIPLSRDTQKDSSAQQVSMMLACGNGIASLYY